MIVFSFALQRTSSIHRSGIYGFYGFGEDINNARAQPYRPAKFKTTPLQNKTGEMRYYDPVSGANVTVGSLETPYTTYSDMECFDSVNNIFYTLVILPIDEGIEDYQPIALLGFYLSNASITYFIDLPMIINSDIFLATSGICVGDPSTGDMLSFYFDFI